MSPYRLASENTARGSPASGALLDPPIGVTREVKITGFRDMALGHDTSSGVLSIDRYDSRANGVLGLNEPRESRGSTGQKGEEIAATHIRSAGYHIVCKNYRFHRCEVDIIALDGDTLVFVEVKTRMSLRYGHPILAITPSKKRNIIMVARAFTEKADFSWKKIRFDVLTVILTPGKVLVEHVRDAFRSGS